MIKHLSKHSDDLLKYHGVYCCTEEEFELADKLRENKQKKFVSAPIKQKDAFFATCLKKPSDEKYEDYMKFRAKQREDFETRQSTTVEQRVAKRHAYTMQKHAEPKKKRDNSNDTSSYEESDSAEYSPSKGKSKQVKQKAKVEPKQREQRRRQDKSFESSEQKQEKTCKIAAAPTQKRKSNKVTFTDVEQATNDDQVTQPQQM